MVHIVPGITHQIWSMCDYLCVPILHKSSFAFCPGPQVYSSSISCNFSLCWHSALPNQRLLYKSQFARRPIHTNTRVIACNKPRLVVQLCFQKLQTGFISFCCRPGHSLVQVCVFTAGNKLRFAEDNEEE